MDNVIEFRNVSIDYEMKKFNLHAVNDATFNLSRGKITSLVGESGSGKSTLASSLIGCISEPGRLVKGQVIYRGKDGTQVDIGTLKENELNKFRWEKISMVFQGAQSALNPVRTIFQQFYETLFYHNVRISKKEAKERFEHILSIVNLSSSVLDSYPHEISGGMKQRVMIAFALLLNPEVVILDEPTTALDVITQKHIFNLLKKINAEMQTTMLLLTHDIAIVAEYSDYMGVMYGGRIMEFGPVGEVFSKKVHPYTKGLIYATPSLLIPNEQIASIPGVPPDMTIVQTGCPFAPRCPQAMDKCFKEVPSDVQIGPGHYAKCFLSGKEKQDA